MLDDFLKTPAGHAVFGVVIAVAAIVIIELNYRLFFKYVLDFVFALIAVIVTSPVLIVGAGGMAEAAVFVMQEKGAEVYIKNRTEEKAEELCRKSGAMLFKSGLSPDMIVNCSSAELFGGKVDLSGVATQNLKFAYDTVYKNTEFVSTLSAAGVKVASGLNMLIYQAVKAVEIFTDIVLQDDEIERLKDKIRSELIK